MAKHYMTVEVEPALQKAVKKAAKARGVLFYAALAEALRSWLSAQKESTR